LKENENINKKNTEAKKTYNLWHKWRFDPLCEQIIPVQTLQTHDTIPHRNRATKRQTN